MGIGATVFAGSKLYASEPASPTRKTNRAENADSASAVPVRTPDIADLAFTMDNGVKVFHLTAESVKQEILPGKVLDLWGYNGSAPGPTIQVNEGDRVRIVFDNHLPEPSSIH